MASKKKIFTWIIIIIGVIIIVPLITALFVRKDYSAEREVVINKPKEEVFNYIKLLKNQDEYSKWFAMDPNMKKTYTGTDGTVGFISAWDSDNHDVGKGEQEIKAIKEGERIDFELRFIKPFEGTEKAYMTVESVSDNETKVKWGFDGKLPYPMNIFFLFMDIDKMIADDLDVGLENLKKELEAE